MLPKKQRMDRKRFKEFSALNPFSVFNRLGTLKFLPSGNSFSVVVSSKNCKKAVLRNKARRRAYSGVRLIIKKNPSLLSGVLYLSKQSYSFEFEEFQKLLTDLFIKAYANRA